jgi:uncharacterized membrane protein
VGFHANADIFRSASNLAQRITPMKTLFAVTYPSAADARAAMAKLADLQKGQTITVMDAVIVSRSSDGAVKLEQSLNTTAMGAVSGALWGSLIA